MQSRCISKIPKIAVALTVSLMLAFMPFTVNLQKYRITLERNEAHAIAPVFVGALAFLEEAAAAAGFATVGEFVATGAGITAVASGLTIGTAAGIQLGDSASNNLDALIDAADYPSWDTLSSSKQEAWVSSDNYNAAKYNSLMAGFGLGDDYERYKSTWGSFSPGEFQFSSSANDKLEQMGEIGQNWISGAGNTIGDILNSFNRQQMIQAADVYMGKSDYTVFNGADVPGYPADLPLTMYVNQGNNLVVMLGDSEFMNVTTSEVVYWLITSKSSNNGYLDIAATAFSKNAFTRTWNNNTYNANLKTFEGQDYYVSDLSSGRFWSGSVTTNMQINPNWSDTQYSNRTKAIPYILFNDMNFGEYEPIPDYPEQQINNNEITNIEIYYPVGGIKDTTDWEDLTTHTVTPENPEVNLDSVITLLQHIDSDLHNLNIPGEPNLQPIINYLQHIDGDLHKFTFINGDTLKVHDGAVYTELENIYNVLVAIAQKMKNWGDISDAPDLIGDFDFDELEEKVPDLLETISDLAPFGSILLLSEMYSILANYTQIESPELVFPFDFGGFDDKNHELVIDLSWLDDIKPLINFFCIAMLVIAIANATIRIVEIEAAS